MLYFILRTKHDNEPIALMRFNGKEPCDVHIDYARKGRFGYYSPMNKDIITDRYPYSRCTRHVGNIMLGDNIDLVPHFRSEKAVVLEQTTQSEWESWDAMELFPRLKTSVVT